jgi:hypothetical protein
VIEIIGMREQLDFRTKTGHVYLLVTDGEKSVEVPLSDVAIQTLSSKFPELFSGARNIELPVGVDAVSPVVSVEPEVPAPQRVAGPPAPVLDESLDIPEEGSSPGWVRIEDEPELPPKGGGGKE